MQKASGTKAHWRRHWHDHSKHSAETTSILIGHPWLDGNKRTGLGLALFLLLRSGLRVEAAQDELYTMTIRVAEGKSSAEEIQAWIEARVRPL
ncbi:MAG: type II toxin-antitoxin system death-on-curing family toxin [Flavobacteriales bacterium]|nr:type II toxin-antitoxin system death-on-curing family toxin [Flavobacteriales bacterium]